MLSNKTIDQLWRIVAAGGSLDFDASRFTTEQLWRLAAATQTHGSKITFRGISNRTTDELWRLVVAGQGNVTISD